ISCRVGPTITNSSTSTANGTAQAYGDLIWTATDSSNNSTTCTPPISYVLSLHDALPISADAQLQCGESTSVASNGTASATDNCGGSPTLTHTDTATANCTRQAGVDRIWTATDSCNNSASCTQHISYVDTTAPAISCPADA